MKWEHGAEDDIDYDEHNLDGVNKDEFVDEFVAFLKAHKEYEIIIAEENSIVVSAMFVYLVPKLPKPNGNAKYIAYLTNLLFAWPSDNSIAWYQRNGFNGDNEIFECPLCEE